MTCGPRQEPPAEPGVAVASGRFQEEDRCLAFGHQMEGRDPCPGSRRMWCWW